MPEIGKPAGNVKPGNASGIYPSGNILGLRVDAVDMSQCVQTIESWIARREAHYVCLTAAHSIMAARNDPLLLRIFNQASLTVPDGMGIVWLMKAKRFAGTGRVYSSDLLLRMCEKSLSGKWRHFFYGGNPGVAERMADRLCALYPGLQVAGFYSPPFHPLQPEEDRAVARRISDSRADIVWVGIGTAKQEYWMAEHLGKVGPAVLIGVGAAFDFISGNKPEAPRWIQRIGMEWFFRLLTEPRRLGKRYMEYPLFVGLVIAQMLGLRKYE